MIEIATSSAFGGLLAMTGKSYIVAVAATAKQSSIDG
jgi:hypothetical protein